jgi:hypothetical protein
MTSCPERVRSMKRLWAAPPANQWRGGMLTIVLASLLVTCGDGPDPEPAPSQLATTFVIVVTDSVEQGVGGVYVQAQGWVSDTAFYLRADSPGSASSSNGRVRFRWPELLPVHYDSLTFLVPQPRCRPYASARLGLPGSSLHGQPGDSIERRLTLGLAEASPRLVAGAKVCAAGVKEFGAFELRLAIDAWPSTDGDSIRARWDIFFQETSALYPDDAAGVVRGDSLLVHLRINAPAYCAPGYLLQARLEGTRLDAASMTTLNRDYPSCSALVQPIHSLRFAPLVDPFWP